MSFPSGILDVHFILVSLAFRSVEVVRMLRKRFWIVLLILATSLLGQRDANKANVSGLVVDTSNAPVPDATVVAQNSGTGIVRETRTNQHGYYTFTSVDSGAYDFKVEASSISVGIKNVEIHAGATVEVDVKVALDKSREKVDLASSSVSITDSISTHVMPLDVIRDLPIDGRRFQDFATLAPAVQSNPATRNELSFLGQRGVYGNVMVDGSDYNEPFLGGIRGSERAMFAFTIPQSAIQEFQTITNGYSAEYGRSTGGILNAISRSGNNATHGEAFYQIRDSQLSLQNPFGLDSLERQQQLGGAAGGPVKRERLFWFAAAEGQLASLPRTVRFAALDSVANQLTPNIRPAYDYFRSLEGPFTQTNNAFAVLGRLDYQFRNASRLTGRFSDSRNHAANAVSEGTSWSPQTTSALSNNGAEEDTVRSAVLQWTGIFRPTMVNDLRVSYSGEQRDSTANSATPDVEAGVIGNFGTGINLPLHTDDYRLQFADSLSLQRGLHNFVLGGDYSLLHVNHGDGMNQFGTFVLSGSDVGSLLAILSATGGTQGNRFDDPSVVYLRQVGNASIEAQAHQIAFFGQDEWRVHPRLTIGYGLRWEGQLNPSPRSANTFLVSNVLNYPFPLGRVDPTHVNNQLNQWAPRVSTAWNVSGSGKTVVRAGLGLFYGQTPLAFYANALNNFGAAGGDLSLQIAPLDGMTVYQQFARAGFDLNHASLNQLPLLSVADVWIGIAGGRNQWAQSNVFTTSGANFHNPRSLQLAASVEHQLTTSLTVSYQLNHLNTVHLPRVVDVNVPEPFVQPGDLSLRPFFGLRSGTPRPNPNLGAVYVLDSSARSTFMGHTFLARYRLNRIEFIAHYLLSYTRSDDDLEWPFTSTTYQNPFNLSREWGWSSLDARHQGSGYVVYHAPKGFEITGLFHARSGLPIDATTGGDTSELLAGNTGNPPLERPGIPFARNAFRNLGYRTIDIRLLKSFQVREAAKLQLSAEMFNLFNFNNVAFTSAYDYPNNPAFTYGLGVLPNGQPASVNPGFLQLRTARGGYNAATEVQQGTPFQAQLGVRFQF
jgi:hypothetical protein